MRYTTVLSALLFATVGVGGGCGTPRADDAGSPPEPEVDVVLRDSASSELAVDSDSVGSVTRQALTLEENADADMVPSSLSCDP